MNKKIIIYKFFLFISFLVFILISVFSVFYINIPSVDEGLEIERNKVVLEGKGISNDNYGLFLSPLIFFWLFGTSIFILRISQVFFLFLTLFLFSKLKLSPMKKIIGLFLLATSPFIIPGRSEENFLPFFALLSFILLDEKEINSKKVFISSFVLGFGSTVKLTILFFALPFLFFSTLFKRFEKRKILSLILGLILGLSPFFIADAVSNFPTLKYLIEVILNKKTVEGYEIFNLFPNSALVLSQFSEFLHFFPYDLRPSYEFSILPFVNLSVLFLTSIYFSLFFLFSFILIKRRQRLELTLPCLIFIFLLQFTPSSPKPCNFYFISPFIVFLILECIDKKYLPFLIIPLLAGSLLTYGIIKNLPDEKYFPDFGAYNHELLSFLTTSNSSIIVTPLFGIRGFQPFLNFKEMIIPIEYSFKNGVTVNEEGLNHINLLIEKNESLIFVFPSYERKTLKERLIYKDCYKFNNIDYFVTYPCYDATEIIKNKFKIFGKFKLVKTINDGNGLPVYEIFNLVYTKT